MNSSYNYPMGYSNYNSYFNNDKRLQSGNNERFIGSGFIFPFLLGGVTGAAVAPAFWRPPYNGYYGPYYGPGPFYRPF